jgi:hypothetical protein
MYAPPPYEPPATALKTFGILSVVFSCINALGNVGGVLQGALAQRQLASVGSSGVSIDEHMRQMSDYVDAVYRVAAVQGGVMVLMDIALFVIGILLLQRREVGRQLAMAWAVMAFVVLVGRAAAFEIVLWPRFSAFMQSSVGAGRPSGFFGMMDTFAHVSAHLSLLVMAIFPVCLLVFMTRPSVIEAIRDRSRASVIAA